MFRKKNKITIEIDQDNININHNLTDKLDLKEIERIITILIKGDVGRFLLDDLRKKYPDMNKFCEDLYLKLHPVTIVNRQPIIRPSQVMNNYIMQIKGIAGE